MKKLAHLFVVIALFAQVAPAFAAKKGFEEMLNIMRCTNQWDFTIYNYSYRQKGMSKDDARKKMLANWVRPSSKQGFREVITDAINGANDHVYGEKEMPKKFSRLLISTNRGFNGCLRKYKLQKYRRHLAAASTKAGLVTLWDYYRRNGIKKEQIIAQQKKMPVRSRKMLDAVYSDGFNINRYRLSAIWHPTIDTISLKFHGVKINR